MNTTATRRATSTTTRKAPSKAPPARGTLAALQATLPRRRKLRSKLSDLLEDAIDDAQAAEAVGVGLDMNRWALEQAAGPECGDPGCSCPAAPAVCSVCLGGASMVRRLGAKDTDGLSEADLSKIYALDDLRQGLADTAASRIGAQLSAAQYDDCYAVGRYIRGRFDHALGRAPWRVYRTAVRHLRKVGL